MMKRVYLVSTGEYSDYDILGVFSTRGKANDFCDTFHSSNCGHTKPEIQGMILDEFDDIVVACKDKKVFNVEMNLVDGDVNKVQEKTGELEVARLALEKKLAIINGVIIASVFADDKKHAVKIIAEQRTRMIVQM